MELQGPAKKPNLPSDAASSALRLLPAYVKHKSAGEVDKNGDDAVRSGMRAEIEEFLL